MSRVRSSTGSRAVASRYQAFRFAYAVLPRTERRLMAAKLTSGIALGFLGTLPPLLIRTLLDTVLPSHDAMLLVELVLAGLALYTLLAVAGIADQWLQSRVSEGLGRALRNRFFDRIAGLPFAFFVHARSGSLISRLTVDVRTAQGIMRNSGSVVTSTVTVVATLSVMLWLSSTVTLLALAIVPFVVLADNRFSARIAAQSQRKLASYAGLTSYVTERTNPGGALLIRAAGAMETEVSGFRRHSQTVWRTAIRSAVLNRAYYGVLAICAGFGILTVIYVGGEQALSGELQVGALVALLQYAARSYQPIIGIARTRMQILDAAVAINRIRTFVESEMEEPDVSARTEGPVHAWDVVFEDVWFRYPVLRAVDDGTGDTLPVLVDDASPWVLRGVSFHAAAGNKIAIVGESGVGKTTIAQLLVGLYHADKGTVRLGGTDVTRLSAEAIRGGVGLVTQEAFLFSGTLADNIRYTKPGASDDEVAAACVRAGVHDDVQALPNGYATVVGERGYRLSGGQKQRIALARALLSNCPIIVLDEATSHLESGRDETIQRDLLRESADRVLIVVAHRLSSVVDADEILVLSDGEIVERGRHAELEAADGHYAFLFRSQRRPDHDPTRRSQP